MANDQFGSTATSTGGGIVTSTSSSTATGQVVVAISSGNFPRSKSAADIEKAVYAHIQAVRALGRDQINTVEIANALSISQESVIAAIARLQGKGVRVAA